MNTIYRIMGYALWPVFWLIFPIRRRVSVVILVGDEILVVKHKIYFGQWNLPGGGVKRNESPLDAVIRECKEELGVTVHSSELIKLTNNFVTVREFGITSKQKIFALRIAKKPLIASNNEIESYKWVNKEDQTVGADARKAISLL